MNAYGAFTMTILYSSRAAILAGLFLVACSPKSSTVEIGIPPTVKASFDELKPPAKFAFYAIKNAEPESADDVKKRTVFTCCELEPEDVAMGLRNVPYWQLFASAQFYGIYHAPGCDPAYKGIQNYAIQGAIIDGETVNFVSKSFLYCQKEDRVLMQAIEAVRASHNGILLAPRSSKVPADFVEVVLK